MSSEDWCLLSFLSWPSYLFGGVRDIGIIRLVSRMTRIVSPLLIGLPSYPNAVLTQSEAVKPLAAQPFPLSTSPTSPNYPYPTDSIRPFASVEKAALRDQSSNEERLGNPSTLSTPDQSSPSDYHSGVNPTSASELNVSRPSNATNDVGVEMFGHSESATTSSSLYAPSSPRPGEDGPPPYQPLSAAKTVGVEHQIRSPIQEESESGTFG